MPPAVSDRGRTTTDTDSDGAHNHEEAPASNGTNLLEYDLENWKLATRCATRHELVATWAFENIIVQYPSRVCGWEEGSIDEHRPAVTWHGNDVDVVYYYVQDWESATRRAVSNNRIRKHVFDVLLKQTVALICRASMTNDIDPENPPPPPPPPALSPASRHRLMLPPRYPSRQPTSEAVRPTSDSPPPRYTSHPPGPQAPPLRYASRGPERPQRSASERNQGRVPQRTQRRASPQPRHGRDQHRSRSPVRREVEYYPDHVVPVTRNGQRFLIRRSVASQHRIAREQYRAAARRDVRQAARQRGHNVIILD
ncbi:hypothetical protein KCU65_g1956, partial [Aureobasidium melanogenum]